MGLFLILFCAHIFFLNSVFDIYFKSPIIENVSAIQNNITTSTKRLVLFVGDGLPAEYLLDFSSNTTKSPFLRSVIKEKGRWGISHTRVPTESRPGHVALIAGFYEDPSAVFKGWKENPVPFDSVFNQSYLTLSWGSPDIVPMFSKGTKIDHIHYFSYSSDMEDMSGKNNSASQLDLWVYDCLENFIEANLTHYDILNKSGVIFFFHLLGADVAGHANKPNSNEYDHTIKNMDMVVKKIYLLLEKTFPDNKTTYLFTSDHGMTAWGSHGAGSKIETETPIIAWGAGIKKPMKLESIQNLTPNNWQLRDQLSENIDQADIAVLMSILLGVSIPAHSVGTLPLGFLDFNDVDKARALLLNARQLITQLKAKEYQVKANIANVLFKPYWDIYESNTFEDIIYEIEDLIKKSNFVKAEELTHNLITLTLSGIDYYHMYYKDFLLVCAVLSFLGLTAIIIGEIMSSYKNYKGNYIAYSMLAEYRKYVVMNFLFLFTSILLLCWADALPGRYSIYLITPLCLWNWTFMKYPWIFQCIVLLKKLYFLEVLLYTCAITLMVFSFYHRWVLSLGLLGLIVWPVMDHDLDPPKNYILFWRLSCLALSVFPLLPIVGGKELLFFKISTGCLWFFLQLLLLQSSTFRFIGIKHHLVTIVHVGFTPLMLWNIYEISNSFNKGEGLPLINQLISNGLLVIFLGIMPFGPSRLLPRFNTLSYSMGLPFLMFSSSYEALFPLLLSANLLCWIFFERLISLKVSIWETSQFIFVERSLSRHDVRRCFFYIFYIILSFFGIGNLASLNSFDMVWVRSFITVFSPFTMMALLLLKVIIPFILVTCAFRFVVHITQANSRSLFLIVLIICDSMAVQFLFAIKNKGSWLEIGTSISHFVIMKSIVLFLLILFYLTKYITASTAISISDCDNFLGKKHES